MKEQHITLRRILAYIFDYLILAFIVVVIGGVTGYLSIIGNSSLARALSWVTLVLGLVYPTLLNAWLTSSYGGTIGKLLLGLEVTRAQEQIRFMTALMREVVRTIQLPIFVLALINLYLLLKDEQQQLIHDRLAGTVVKHRQEVKVVGTIVGFLILTAFIAIVPIILALLTPAPVEPEGYGNQTGAEASMLPDITSPTAPQINLVSPTDSDELELTYGQVSSENVLQVTGTENTIKGVVHTRWDRTGNFILFSKTELELTAPEDPTDFPDYSENSGNIWVADFDGSNTRQVYDHPSHTTIDFVSNGRRIAYAVNNEIGVIDLDGSNRSIIYEFTPGGTYSNVQKIPTLEIYDENTFTAVITSADGVETKEFSF